MKMDFPHQASRARPSQERYANLVACASNGQFRRWWGSTTDHTPSPLSEAGEQLQARIKFFAHGKMSAEPAAYGAFAPETGRIAGFEMQSEIGVNRDASAIGKPSFLGSRYPAEPDSLRGMEN